MRCNRFVSTRAREILLPNLAGWVGLGRPVAVGGTLARYCSAALVHWSTALLRCSHHMLQRKGRQKRTRVQGEIRRKVRPHSSRGGASACKAPSPVAPSIHGHLNDRRPSKGVWSAWVSKPTMTFTKGDSNRCRNAYEKVLHDRLSSATLNAHKKNKHISVGRCRHLAIVYGVPLPPYELLSHAGFELDGVCARQSRLAHHTARMIVPCSRLTRLTRRAHAGGRERVVRAYRLQALHQEGRRGGLLLQQPMRHVQPPL